MPFVSETSKTLILKDMGYGDWADYYQQATVVLSTSGDVVSYRVTMNTNAKRGLNVSLYLSIDGQVIFNDYYTDTTRFPTLDGSTASGSVTTVTQNNPKISVELKICAAQDAQYGSDRWVETSATLTRTWYTPVTGGTVEIVDNYDNTFTITASAPKISSTINNAIWGLTNLKWGYDTRYLNTYINKSVIPLTVDIPTDGTAAGDTRRVYAKSTTDVAYGTDPTVTSSADIRQYIAPSTPGKPQIIFSKNRLTTKENWTFSWDSAVKANNTSPLKGYRMRLFKNGKSIPILNNSGNVLSTQSGNDYYYDRDNTVHSITINPALHGFEPGDKVNFTVFSYTKYGLDNTGTRLYSNASSSLGDTVVQNAGILRVKTPGGWKEGQVFVKVDNTWKEAEVIYSKVDGVWKESE